MPELFDSHKSIKYIGAKAKVLQELSDIGFPVPPFEVSPIDIVGAVERLGSPLAVRSCATVEDGHSNSFAGLFRSVLNVVSPLDLEMAVATCLESRVSESVLRYLRRNGIESHSIGMDVIVQRMVSARLSGVAFSIDPLTGEDRVVIEACEGLGDQFLAGKSPPVADNTRCFVNGDRRLKNWRKTCNGIMARPRILSLRSMTNRCGYCRPVRSRVSPIGRQPAFGPTPTFAMAVFRHRSVRR